MSFTERLREWLRPYRASGPHAAAFRARQVSAILRVTPWVVLGNSLAAMIVVAMVRTDLPVMLPIAWAAAVMSVSMVGVPSWWRLRRQSLVSLSERTFHKTTLNGALLGSLWALAPLVAYPLTDSPGREVLIAMSVGMLGAGGFALAPAPVAANAFVATLGSGMFGALARSHQPTDFSLMIGLVFYLAIILAMIESSARNLGARLAAEADAATQKELVAMLLSDFQEHSSDWLWETDAQGCLREVSPRLAEVLGQPASELQGRHFSRLLDELRPAASDPVEPGLLERKMDELKPFTGIDFEVCPAGQIRWWTLSGKPLHSRTGKIVGWRGVGSDVTVPHLAQQNVQRMAATDAVTGLANRHAFQQALAVVSDRPCALFYLDLDNFKGINDVYGHATGDRALKAAAEALQRCLGRGDLLARVGGDEFAILRWSRLDELSLSATAASLCNALHHPIEANGTRVHLGTSVGIAISPDHAVDGESLLRCADMALYAAKNAGRGRCTIYTSSLGESRARRHRLREDLKIALERGQLDVHYQPQFASQGGRMVGAEALLRWSHPEHGRVSPMEFIPLAEESGAIARLGDWVLEQSCLQAMRWDPRLHVAVNVSARQLVDPFWVQRVRHTLETTGLAPQRLELELTETVLIENSLAAMQAIVALRALGVRITLDDFGTGYSSLVYLRNFPFDRIKIDRTFVRNMTQDLSARAIVEAVVHLAESLGLEVTAEGVETPEQFAVLHDVRCTDVQGHLFARAMPAEDMARFLGQHDLDSTHWIAQTPLFVQGVLQ